MSEQERLEREKRMLRIQRVSAVMKWLVTGLLIALAGFGVVVILGIILPGSFLSISDETIDLSTMEREIVDIPEIQRLGLAVLTTAAFALLLTAFWNLRQVFKGFQELAFFSSNTLSSIISFGVWLLVFSAFDLVSDPIGSVIATYDFPPGERIIDVAFDGGEVFFLVLGSLMLLFGWILREAALIDEENQQIV